MGVVVALLGIGPGACASREGESAAQAAEAAGAVYRNENYLFSFQAPLGLACQPHEPPLPNHGCRLDLPQGEGSFVFVVGDYNSADRPSAEDALESSLGADLTVGTTTTVLRRERVTLGDLEGFRMAVRVTREGSRALELKDTVMALRDVPGFGEILYTLGLETSAARYEEDVKVLDQVLSSWRAEPPPDTSLIPCYEEAPTSIFRRPELLRGASGSQVVNFSPGARAPGSEAGDDLSMSSMSGSAWSEMAGMVVPRRWGWSGFSTTGQVVLGSLVVVGLAAGLWFSSRKPALYVSMLRLASWIVMLATLVAHALTAWVLEVDPGRNQSGIPLPETFSALATALTLALHLAGPLFIGVATAQLVHAVKGRRLDGLTVLSSIVALYVAAVVPWTGRVVWD